MSSAFATLTRPCVFIAAPGDMDYLRRSTVELFARLQKNSARGDDALEIYDYKAEFSESGFRAWKHAQLQIPPPSNPNCEAVICFVGERIGTPLSTEVPLDEISNSPALKARSSPRAILPGVRQRKGN